VVACYVTSFSQGSLCPPNIDFRLGNFTNWECRTGNVGTLAGTNTLTWFSFQPDPSRHQLIAPTNTELDEYGMFPKRSPNSTSYSVRLGNNLGGHEAEAIFYTFTIPANVTKFSLLYNYAIVLQNPGHRAEEQPRFRARIVDEETETEVNCVSFDFTASGTLPGFQPTPGGDAVYKDWTPVSVDLSSYAGKTIRLEFITSDCVFQEHFGYAYVNISSVCNGSITGSLYCQGDSVTTLTAPFGFQQYRWFSDDSFTQEISTQQQIPINIATTPVGSVLPVIISPYTGYGCVDTLYAIIGQSQKPPSMAGPDQVSCSKQPTQLGSIMNNEDYSYSWSPANLVSNPIVANPFSAYGLQNVTEFVLQTTDLASGCQSFDTAIVTPVIVDTATTISGELIYCPGEALTTVLSVDNTTATAQWYKANDIINGATALNYQPVTAGTYWAEIREQGCIDSSRQIIIRLAAVPEADFGTNKDIQCLNEPISFINRTTIAGNEPVNYVWRFSDGTSVQGVNVEKAFSENGYYLATLIATSGTDCIDSIQKQVMIIDDCMPVMPTAFTPNRDGKNDELKPYLPGAKGLKRFAVYNRWGNLVFATTKEGQGWDGTYNGKPLQTAVFVWTIEYIDKENKTQVRKGTVTLIQ